jgi:hypothetical protein
MDSVSNWYCKNLYIFSVFFVRDREVLFETAKVTKIYLGENFLYSHHSYRNQGHTMFFVLQASLGKL